MYKEKQNEFRKNTFYCSFIKHMEIYSYLDVEVLRMMSMLKVSQYMIKILMLLTNLKRKIM
jgi:hypothetical protein